MGSGEITEHVDKSVDRNEEEPVSLLEGAEEEVNAWLECTKNKRGTKAQPRNLGFFQLNIKNLEMLVQQLILKLQSDVDKLWIYEQEINENIDLEALEDSVTLLLQKRVWGEKETIISCLTKLLAMLDKMLRLERDMAALQGEDDKEPIFLPLDSDDKALIKRYFLSKYQS